MVKLQLLSQGQCVVQSRIGMLFVGRLIQCLLGLFACIGYVNVSSVHKTQVEKHVVYMLLLLFFP